MSAQPLAPPVAAAAAAAAAICTSASNISFRHPWQHTKGIVSARDWDRGPWIRVPGLVVQRVQSCSVPLLGFWSSAGGGGAGCDGDGDGDRGLVLGR